MLSIGDLTSSGDCSMDFVNTNVLDQMGIQPIRINHDSSICKTSYLALLHLPTGKYTYELKQKKLRASNLGSFLDPLRLFPGPKLRQVFSFGAQRKQSPRSQIFFKGFCNNNNNDNHVFLVPRSCSPGARSVRLTIWSSATGQNIGLRTGARAAPCFIGAVRSKC